MDRLVEVEATRLALLERKSIAHDDYLSAIRTVEKRYATIRNTPPWTEFARGYRDAIEDLARATACAVKDRFTEADMVGTVGPPELLDRDVPQLPVSRGRRGLLPRVRLDRQMTILDFINRHYTVLVIAGIVVLLLLALTGHLEIDDGR